MAEQKMQTMAYLRFAPADGAGRAGSFGASVTTVHAAGIDWTITFDPDVVGGDGLQNGDYTDARLVNQGAPPIAVGNIAQLLVRPGAAANQIRVTGVDTGGVIAANATGSDVIVKLERSNVRG